MPLQVIVLCVFTHKKIKNSTMSLKQSRQTGLFPLKVKVILNNFVAFFLRNLNNGENLFATENLFCLLRYAYILQIIAVVLITLGLIGKVFNCIIFLRKPVCIHFQYSFSIKFLLINLASWYINRFTSTFKNNIRFCSITLDICV